MPTRGRLDVAPTHMREASKSRSAEGEAAQGLVGPWQPPVHLARRHPNAVRVSPLTAGRHCGACRAHSHQRDKNRMSRAVASNVTSNEPRQPSRLLKKRNMLGPYPGGIGASAPCRHVRSTPRVLLSVTAQTHRVCAKNKASELATESTFVRLTRLGVGAVQRYSPAPTAPSPASPTSRRCSPSCLFPPLPT
jgi:hypothetical protein